MKTIGSHFKEQLDTLNVVFLSVLLSASAVTMRPEIGRRIFGLVLSIVAAILIAPPAGNLVATILAVKSQDQKGGKKMNGYRWLHKSLSGIAILAVIAVSAFGNPRQAKAQTAGADGVDLADERQDPWEPFNEKMFWFNRQADRFILKPIATGYDWVMPDPVQRSVKNAVDNLGVARRLTNNLLQLKFAGAGQEVARFAINSTVGVGGLFDVAKDGLGIKQSDEDTGQTLGYYGVGQGPYLVLPFLPVTTVRDGIGSIADAAMNPLIYIAPLGATLGVAATGTINDRSLNLDKYQSVEESVVDLYGAVRDAYLQRREAKVRE